MLEPSGGHQKDTAPTARGLAEAVTVLLQTGLEHNKEPRKELEKILQAEGVTKEWFPEHNGQCTYNMRINSHLGARRVMTLERIQDPKGAKTVIISFKTTSRAMATIHRQTDKIVCFKDALGGRLRVDDAVSAGEK